MDRGDGIRLAVIGGSMPGVSIDYELAAKTGVVVLEQDASWPITLGLSLPPDLEGLIEPAARPLATASIPQRRPE